MCKSKIRSECSVWHVFDCLETCKGMLSPLCLYMKRVVATGLEMTCKTANRAGGAAVGRLTCEANGQRGTTIASEVTRHTIFGKESQRRDKRHPNYMLRVASQCAYS